MLKNMYLAFCPHRPQDHLSEDGVAQEQVAAQLYWENRTVDLVRQWRKVHVPITMTFGVLALAHIIAVFLFWGWR